MSKMEVEVSSLEQKLDSLLLSMEGLNKWKSSVDSSVSIITKPMGNIMSRIEALEAEHAAPPSAPSREAEVRASGHR
ncbi:hypothetical protein PR202_ga08171 [Eleusine coracana subsp. coracana]|uniref:Uncharacterized protein n=1 Tax=Eleusine coracana subsp. coracana TaxID=191504 RepID=A0AAV5BZV9_ELECO|nr:hypothetical protein PR202_ga08171 [Eleusine coracana subsp. coracana]